MVNVDDSFIVNSDKFISSAFGDEMMLMNLETGDYIGLNEVSAEIFKLAEKKTPVAHIIDHLLQQYNVEEDICRVQVLSCLENMLEKELLIKI